MSDRTVWHAAAQGQRELLGATKEVNRAIRRKGRSRSRRLSSLSGVQWTDAHRYVLSEAAVAGGCPVWELAGGSRTYTKDRVLTWSPLGVDVARAAALDLLREGLISVWGESVDADGRLTSEVCEVAGEETVRSLSDSDNWLEPWTAPGRVTTYNVRLTPSGVDALEERGPPEPDVVVPRSDAEPDRGVQAS